MHLSTAIAFANVAGLAAARPMRTLSIRDVTSFPAGLSWDILLNKGDDAKGSVKPAEVQNAQVIDIDLVDNSKETIQELKGTMKVICYFSAGSKEPNRPDTKDFKPEDSRNEVKGWAGENWLDVKSENVHNIMKKRIDMAVDKGCDAVDPDNVDGYGNNDGFGYDKSAYADYVKLLADYANHHPVRPIASGLKNAVELFQQFPDVVNAVQFAVNEECRVNNECDAYKAFTNANKAVFNVEYNSGTQCGTHDGVSLSTVNKPDQSLAALGGVCAASGDNNNQPSATPTYAVPSGGKSTTGPQSTTLPAQQSSTPTGAASKPTPTGAQGEDKDGYDNDDDSDNSDNENNGNDSDDDDNNEAATSTRASGRPTGYPSWSYEKGQKGKGRHSHSGLATSATPTPTAE